MRTLWIRLTWRKSLPSMDEELVGLITSRLRTSTAGSPSRPPPPDPPAVLHRRDSLLQDLHRADRLDLHRADRQDLHRADRQDLHRRDRLLQDLHRANRLDLRNVASFLLK
ncbi:unnamed protein product [Gadus morhua 'NCC']